ncbi:ATP-binding cassette domain-containing protein [Chitiniphilus shinanonensis]
MQLHVDISKAFRSAGRRFDLSVAFQADAPRVVIYGASGAGKSLTLKAIAGLITPDHGRISVDGADFFDSQTRLNLAPRQRKVAYVFQDYALFPHLTVRENIGFGLNRGWFNREARHSRADIDQWLDTLHIRNVADQYPAELSGGQRQRTALARALINRPTALLLDEPFAALDHSLRKLMRKELDQLQRALRIPLALITHDREDVEVFGDQVVHLRDGRVTAGLADALA